ncbi:hypothetical protein LA76x_4486 [Lysobacter antibioticus]|uniref:Uncharacterized protein n=1 Tax=Lysobacter antibioticus TaxID=84531 RepID=A0A0S2FGH9_LYSAN|nr:hypothetical protein LA76x_4486 [Lysobacter antibioticus]
MPPWQEKSGLRDDGDDTPVATRSVLMTRSLRQPNDRNNGN